MRGDIGAARSSVEEERRNKISEKNVWGYPQGDLDL